MKKRTRLSVTTFAGCVAASAACLHQGERLPDCWHLFFVALEAAALATLGWAAQDRELDPPAE